MHINFVIYISTTRVHNIYCSYIEILFYVDEFHIYFLDWIAVTSPVSANKPESRDNQGKGVTTTSGSSRDPSDEDDEAGPCEQSTNPIDMKRLRRYITLKHLKLIRNFNYINSLMDFHATLHYFHDFQEGF